MSSFKPNHTVPAHMAIPWVEMDPLKLRVEQDGEEITLMTYRYPVAPGTKRKGIVFYVHGYGSYC